VQAVSSSLSDWRNDVLADPSQQTWFGKIPFSPGVHALSINKKKESYSKLLLTALTKKSERLSTDYRHG
jgi:hypothetical protein